MTLEIDYRQSSMYICTCIPAHAHICMGTQKHMHIHIPYTKYFNLHYLFLYFVFFEIRSQYVAIEWPKDYYAIQAGLKLCLKFLSSRITDMHRSAGMSWSSYMVG